MANRITTVQECDARNDAQGTTVGNIKIIVCKIVIPQKRVDTFIRCQLF